MDLKDTNGNSLVTLPLILQMLHAPDDVAARVVTAVTESAHYEVDDNDLQVIEDLMNAAVALDQIDYQNNQQLVAMTMQVFMTTAYVAGLKRGLG